MNSWYFEYERKYLLSSVMLLSEKLWYVARISYNKIRNAVSMIKASCALMIESSSL